MSREATFTDEDRAFMERALLLAGCGRGRTSPNPTVGAVIVSDGVVAGQGAHLAAGSPHAEVHALAEAGGRSKGATLYCTLEPCAHQGRTPPCAPQVASAGIARAVIAMIDPNPKVAGRGIAMLRASGITVDVGLLEDAARRVNAPFITWITRGRPHVTLKFAQSADGFVGRNSSSALPDAGRTKLTGGAMDRLMHQQRAEVDAIAVGADTLLLDDPMLTPRGAFRERPLTRIVIDWRLRCAGDRALYRTRGTGPVLLFTADAARASAPAAVADLEQRGVEVIGLDARDLAGVLRMLGEREITSLLVEGGPTLQDALASAGLVDRVQRIVTPDILGDGVRMPALLALEGHLGETIETSAGRDTLLEADVYRTD